MVLYVASLSVRQSHISSRYLESRTSPLKKLYNRLLTRRPTCEPVWPSGKAVGGKQRDLGSNLLRLSFLFKSCGLRTLSCDFVPHDYETLKWLSSLPTLMQKSFR